MSLFSRLVFLVFLFVLSCTKIKITDAGADLIPAVDNVNTFDTFLTVQTKMAGFDTVTVLPQQLQSLGLVNDPVFGGINAQINAEFKPVGYPYFFEKNRDSLFTDSIVLVLQYSSAYGDTLQPLQLSVNEIAQSSRFKTDSFYSNVSASFNSAGALSAGSHTVNILRLKDSIRTFRDSGKGQIRIRLTGNDIANRLLRLYDSTNAYKSDSLFKTFFAGIQVNATSGNALLKIDLPRSKLGIYYRFRQSNGTDSANVRYLVLTTFSGVGNRISRSYPASVQNAISSTAANQEQLFLAAGPGTYANLTIPGLATFKNAAIHRAELQLEQQLINQQTDGYFYEPALLLTGYNDTAGLFAVPYDFLMGASGIQNYSTYGGFPLKVTDANGTYARYNFNLTRYVQFVINKQLNPIRFRLIAPYNPVVASDASGSLRARLSSFPVNNAATGRVLLFGGSHPVRPMRIRIIYSKL